MARKADAKDDIQAKQILDQLNTKTVGIPPTSTGLTADLLPETVFDIDDFDRIKNQITLQLANLEALNILNTIGQITNTQSVSGPLPDTSFYVESSVVASGAGNGKDVFKPPKGQVWMVNSISTTENISGNGTVYVGLKDSVGNVSYFIIDTTSGSPWTPDDEAGKHVYIDSNQTLFNYVFGTFSGTDEVLISYNLIRVR